MSVTFSTHVCVCVGGCGSAKYYSFRSAKEGVSLCLVWADVPHWDSLFVCVCVCVCVCMYVFVCVYVWVCDFVLYRCYT